MVSETKDVLSFILKNSRQALDTAGILPDHFLVTLESLLERSRGQDLYHVLSRRTYRTIGEVRRARKRSGIDYAIALEQLTLTLEALLNHMESG